MSDLLDDATMVAALRRHMTIAAAKQMVASGNLANLNTPGYRARETSFSTELDREVAQGAGLATTDRRHLTGEPVEGSRGAQIKETDGLPERRDGNTVHLERELLSMSAAASEFKAAQTVLAAKFRLVKYAISEGK